MAILSSLEVEDLRRGGLVNINDLTPRVFMDLCETAAALYGTVFKQGALLREAAEAERYVDRAIETLDCLPEGGEPC